MIYITITCDMLSRRIKRTTWYIRFRNKYKCANWVFSHVWFKWPLLTNENGHQFWSMIYTFIYVLRFIPILRNVNLKFPSNYSSPISMNDNHVIEIKKNAQTSDLPRNTCATSGHLSPTNPFNSGKGCWFIAIKHAQIRRLWIFIWWTDIYVFI